jgi:predicted dehydrogenase
MKTINVGLIGSGFVSDIHAASLAQVPGARVLAAASPTKENVEAFARRLEIPHAHTDYRKLLEMPEIDVISIGSPNDTHAEITLAAAAAGKHVICEKPLCMTLAEAEAMVEACCKASVKLMYA